MTYTRFDVTMITDGDEYDATAVISLDHDNGQAYVMPSGNVSLYASCLFLTPTDLRRLADTAEAVHAGTWQGTPTYAEICDTARELRRQRP